VCLICLPAGTFHKLGHRVELLLLLLIEGVASLILGLWIFCSVVFRGLFRDRTLKNGKTIPLQLVIHIHYLSLSLVSFLLWLGLKNLELLQNNKKYRVAPKSVNLKHSLI
jgi:hypothetical protein